MPSLLLSKYVETLPCGSRSIIKTLNPLFAKRLETLTTDVVFPTPPF